MIETDPSLLLNGSAMKIIGELITAYVGGFLSSLTPCVYPVIPITISIVGAKSAKTKCHSFLISLIYVSGLVLSFTNRKG